MYIFGERRWHGERLLYLKIAVEVKSYFEDSFAHAFHGILGQYLNYRLALDMVEPARKMLLAVPEDIYLSEFSRQGIRNSIHFYDVRLIVYNPIRLIYIAPDGKIWIQQNQTEMVLAEMLAGSGIEKKTLSSPFTPNTCANTAVMPSNSAILKLFS